YVASPDTVRASGSAIRFGHQLVTTATGLRSVSNNYQPRLHEITVFDPVAGLALQTIAWADPKEVGNNGLRAYALTADGSTLLVASAAEPPGAKTTSLRVCDVATGRQRALSTVPGYYYLGRTPF